MPTARSLSKTLWINFIYFTKNIFIAKTVCFLRLHTKENKSNEVLSNLNWQVRFLVNYWKKISNIELWESARRLKFVKIVFDVMSKHPIMVTVEYLQLASIRCIIFFMNGAYPQCNTNSQLKFSAKQNEHDYRKTCQ